MKKILTIAILPLLVIALVLPAIAQTVTGGGYTVQQMISPIEGALSGNGYVLNQAAEIVGGLTEGNGFNVGVFGGTVSSSTASSTPSTPTSTYTGSNGGGFYVLPPWVTGQSTSTTASTTPVNPTLPTKPGSILRENGSTCSTRITFSAPIDIMISNNPEDVKKLEAFLNTYEKEKLPVNGVYEPRDVEAVKRWQLKYRTFILDPMRLKQPTGTVYTLSMRQIERQTTKDCGAPILVTACPFFRQNVSYGDRGEAVKQVQQFLNIVQGEKLPVTGVFGPLTKDAVKRFQKARKIYVATYIPISIATGNWFTTTRMKANETIGCDIIK